MLAFEVEYLLGRAFSGSYRSRDEHEWPPHPARLFSALVAASHAHSAPPEGQAALTWLERQDAPAIHAPAADGSQGAFTAFVPPNYFTSKGRGKQPRSFPSVFPRESKVYFVWTNAEPDEATRSHLASLAELVGYLGRSPSLVRVALCDNPPSANYEPAPDGNLSIRVAVPGRLEELKDAFENSQRPTPGARRAYRETGARPSPQGNFGEMIILRKVGGPASPIAATLLVAEKARKAMLELADQRGLGCPAIDGHEDGGMHVAYVPLPFVGFKHADGHLLGLAIVLPRDLDREQTKRVRATAAFLDHLNLGPAGRWELSVDSEDWPQNLRPETWRDASTTWTTATPVLLDRFPKKNLSVEEILRTACGRAGLPDPVEIEHGPYPRLAGVPAVNEFKLQRRELNRAEWGTHVKLKFAEKVRGPIMLGRGRFFGLGLFRPELREDQA